MKQKADIVRADISHIKRIAEIEAECIADGWSENAFRETLENQSALILAAVSEGETVGFLNGSFVLDEAELLNIAVSPEYRRNGVAQQLFSAFETALGELGVTALYLEVRESNHAAISLYEKLGFVRNGLRKNYYRNPVENAVLMAKITG